MSTLLTKIKGDKRTPAKLSDFIKIKHGFAFKGVDFSDIPTTDVLVTPGNFAIGGGFKAEKLKYYDGEVPTAYILNPNDLIVTMTDLSVNADTLGYPAQVPHDGTRRFLHNQRIGLVQKIDENIDFGYLYYLMRSREYQAYVVSTASGSTVRHTSPDRITGYEFKFHSIGVQKRIGEILGSYDKKIQNNDFIIGKLELLAQLTFDEWFIKHNFPGNEKFKRTSSEMGDIPEKWIVKPLDEVADFLNGVASQKFPPIDGKSSLPVIKIREMNSGIDDNTDRANTEIDPKYIVKDGDILFSWSGSLELMTWSGGPGILNQHIFKVTSKEYPQWFYYYWIKKHLQEFRAIASGKATTMGHIQRHHITGALVVVPSLDLIKKADAVISPIFTTIAALRVENHALKLTQKRLLAELI